MRERMNRETTRRAVVTAVLGGGILGASSTSASGLLGNYAPFSGSAWESVEPDLPDEITSEYGSATLRYDDHGVPQIEADTEEALYFAVGYVQAADRLFQMDLQRRQIRGELSEVIGEATVESDRFNVKMDFVGAAEASWRQYEGTELGDLTEAYTAGVNRYIDGPESLPVEFELLEYEPDPWHPVDSFLSEKQVGWSLTGRFRTLRHETVAENLGPDVAETLYPHDYDRRFAHLSRAPPEAGQSGTGASSSTNEELDSPTEEEPSRQRTDLDVVDWLSSFESPPEIGSNSWVISGSETASGAPIVANDPHLGLRAPPTWYEMNLTGPSTNVRGVALPGSPFAIIGETDGGAWGVTNTPVDIIDFYEYETRDDEYRYGDEWRSFDTETTTINVAGGEDRTVTVRKSVHGPVVSSDGDGSDFETMLGISWTLLGSTRTQEGFLGLGRSDGLDDALEATRSVDIPLNFSYADRDGNTHYRVIGRAPIRRTSGEQVPGDQVFDGSAREGEWAGFTPYGDTDWEGDGFIPFEEMPHVDQPDYQGSANQSILESPEDYPYYFEKPSVPPFRAGRLWERLDRRTEGDESVTPQFMRDLQRDTYDKRAEMFVPTILEAGSAFDDEDASTALEGLSEWDYRMDRGSRGALIFSRFVEHYRSQVYGSRLENALGERRDISKYYGNDWVLFDLPPESDWFPDGRDVAIEQALSRAATEIEEEGWETYGDYNRTTITHPFDQSWLNYPELPTDGSGSTLNNFSRSDGWGTSYRMICPMAEGSESEKAFPGGNSGSPFSEHYHDQLEAWADGEYEPSSLTVEGDVAVQFRGDSSE